MPFYMMYADQGLIGRICDRFRFRNSYQKSSYQSRPVCDPDRINLFQCDLCLCQRRLYHLVDLLNMLPGCNLWNNSAVHGVERYL